MLSLLLKINGGGRHFLQKVNLVVKNFSSLSADGVNFLKRAPTTSRVAKRRFNDASSDELEKLTQLLNQNKTANIKVYSCESTGNLALNVLGTVGAFVLLASSYQAWYIFGSERFKSRNIDNESGFLRFILGIISSESFRVGCCFTIAFAGIGILATSFFFTARSLNHMYLLKGGQSLGIVTDGVFGQKMKYVLNLADCSFKSTRKARKPHVYIKEKKRYLYFLMNNVDGVYHEKNLFDHVICRVRS